MVSTTPAALPREGLFWGPKDTAFGLAQRLPCRSVIGDMSLALFDTRGDLLGAGPGELDLSNSTLGRVEGEDVSRSVPSWVSIDS